MNECDEYQDVVEVVVVDDASVAKMSGGDVDAEPYLDSRNTKGHGNHNSNSQSKIGPKLSELVLVRGGGVCGIWWCYAEVVEVCGSIYGIWCAPEQNLVDGDVAARGRMSGWKAGCPGGGCPGLTGRMSGLWVQGRTG